MDEAIQLIGVTAAARQLGVSPLTVRGWLRSGVLPSLRIGGRRLLDAADLRRVVERAKGAHRAP